MFVCFIFIVDIKLNVFIENRNGYLLIDVLNDNE